MVVWKNFLEGPENLETLGNFIFQNL